jgi:hypothetical protein
MLPACAIWRVDDALVVVRYRGQRMIPYKAYLSSLRFHRRIHETKEIETTQITTKSRAQMDERRPPPRCWRFLSQLLHRAVERVGNSVRINDLIRHQLLVEPLCQVRPVGVTHHPVLTISSLWAVCASRATYHIVATTCLKPANSIAAARCMT